MCNFNILHANRKMRGKLLFYVRVSINSIRVTKFHQNYRRVQIKLKLRRVPY